MNVRQGYKFLNFTHHPPQLNSTLIPLALNYSLRWGGTTVGLTVENIFRSYQIKDITILSTPIADQFFVFPLSNTGSQGIK
jgi:hypothetical protein